MISTALRKRLNSFFEEELREAGSSKHSLYDIAERAISELEKIELVLEHSDYYEGLHEGIKIAESEIEELRERAEFAEEDRSAFHDAWDATTDYLSLEKEKNRFAGAEIRRLRKERDEAFRLLRRFHEWFDIAMCSACGATSMAYAERCDEDPYHDEIIPICRSTRKLLDGDERC